MTTNNRELGKPCSATEHMANERTFLSWVRTGIGVMAFGFVVERFSLFVSQLADIFGKSFVETREMVYSHLKITSTYYGIFLVGLGAMIILLAFIKYKQVERQLDQGVYHPSKLLDFMLALSVLLIGISLFIFLIFSI